MTSLSRREEYRLAPDRPSNVVAMVGTSGASHDVRWPAVAEALAALQATGRRAVRIVDVDCGAGSLLLHALRHARALGFIAIEGHGTDGSPALIGRARAAASRVPDLAIGVAFQVADMMAAVAEESDLPADILLWPGLRNGCAPTTLAMLRRAGTVVIGPDGVMARE